MKTTGNCLIHHRLFNAKLLAEASENRGRLLKLGKRASEAGALVEISGREIVPLFLCDSLEKEVLTSIPFCFFQQEIVSGCDWVMFV